LVPGEESDDEYGSDDKWSKAQKGNWDIPPVNILIQKAVENFDEQSNGDEDGQNTNGDQTAFNWEATAA
jgi:hypothetical protein